ncbi:MAG: hypothetical protein HN811_05720, partial [Phycisphaerae bacterium]|nr:hypothetical protein [Phycisphaerae bacterium]
MLILNRFLAATAVLASVATATAEPGGGGFGFGGIDLNQPSAQQFHDSRDRVQIEVVPSRTSVAAGGDLVLAVVFDQQPTWHVHTNAPEVPEALGDPED